jgi:hypothetical protein
VQTDRRAATGDGKWQEREGAVRFFTAPFLSSVLFCRVYCLQNAPASKKNKIYVVNLPEGMEQNLVPESRIEIPHVPNGYVFPGLFPEAQ